MSTLVLKQTLVDLKLSQRELAQHLELSDAAVAQMLNHNKWPKSVSQEALKKQILTFINSSDEGVFLEHKKGGTPSDDDAARSEAPTDDTKEKDMLLRKHNLTPEAKQHFRIFRSPFEDPRSAEEVYMSRDARYVRENMRQIAKHGGFCAIVGESGAGKTTLKRDLAQWARDVQQDVVIIEPSVLGMEDNDIKGKTLKSTHIAEAILHAVAPGQRVYRSSEARFRQVGEALRESHRAGHRHVLVIEEAHCLSVHTLKHLKRFVELEDGFEKLISVVLVGQPELADKLDPRNPRLREVAQRCEIIYLNPLNNELEAYLAQRFEQVGMELNNIISPDAISALRMRLSSRDGSRSFLFPLVIHNVLTAALNEAARLGIPMLTPDVIEGVQ